MKPTWRGGSQRGRSQPIPALSREKQQQKATKTIWALFLLLEPKVGKKTPKPLWAVLPNFPILMSCRKGERHGKWPLPFTGCLLRFWLLNGLVPAGDARSPSLPQSPVPLPRLPPSSTPDTPPRPGLQGARGNPGPTHVKWMKRKGGKWQRW